MSEIEKCPKCGKALKDYDDYGAEYKICIHCGWDERDMSEGD